MKNKKKPSLYKYANFFLLGFYLFHFRKQDNALKNDFFFNKPRENKRSRHLVHGDVITKQ